MNILEVQDIHVYIHSFYILQGVSFKVPQGKTTVFLGRNGAGKTTAMRSILGLNPPREGSIKFLGEEISRLPPYEIVRKGVGYVPDTRRIFRKLTVEQNLILSMRKSIISEETRLENIFKLFPDLNRLSKNKAGELSGGQQQMLAIARALINDNELLLIDEPTEGLAPVLAKAVLKTLVEIKKTGKTILLVEQNFKAAITVGDYYFIFDDGKIAHSGEMSQLTSNKELINRYLGVKV